MFTLHWLLEHHAGLRDSTPYASFLDRARKERSLGRESSSQIALGAYQIFRLVNRVSLLDGSTEDRESFAWQRNQAFNLLSGLEQDSPDTAHLRGLIEALDLPVDRRATTLRTSLSAYAYYLEHEGRYPEALEAMLEAARTFRGEIPLEERPSFALFVARLNRYLTQWDTALLAYSAAAAAADELGDVRSSLISRLGQANVWRGQGDLARARRAIEDIIAESGDLADVRGKAYADLGVVLGLQGHTIDSLVAQYRAFEHAQDELTRCRVLGDLGILLRALGAYHAARLAFEIVARSEVGFVFKTNAVIELMELESAVGDRLGFERNRQIARSVASRMPPSMAVDFRYKGGIGMARFGQIDRARQTLQDALALAEEYHLGEWCSRLERVVGGLDDCRDLPIDVAPAEQVPMWETPAVAEVAAGLERHAGRMAG